MLFVLRRKIGACYYVRSRIAFSTRQLRTAICQLRILEQQKDIFECQNCLCVHGLPLSRNNAYYCLRKCSKASDCMLTQQLHCLMICSDLESVTILENQLIRQFTTYGNMLEASLVFCRGARPDAYTWEAIISAHVGLGENQRALELYACMQNEDIYGGKVVLLCALKACGTLGAVKEGRILHAEIIESGLEFELNIRSTLLNAYAVVGFIDDAWKLFDESYVTDVVSWNAIITCYVQHGQNARAFELFQAMLIQGLQPDKVTCLCVVKLCCSSCAIIEGTLIHDEIIRSGHDSDVILGNALVDMYANLGKIEESLRVFDSLSCQNVISWNSIIAGYAHVGQNSCALNLYMEMHRQGLCPDKVTCLSVMKACGIANAASEGERVHDYILKIGIDDDVSIENALIDMYAKSGTVLSARKVFDKMHSPDMVSWGAMAAGYVENGLDAHAVGFYEKMLSENVKAGKVVLLCVLKACCSIMSLIEGKLIHYQILQERLESDVAVANTLIDMYAKLGYLRDAYSVFDRLHERDVVSWSVLIGGLTQHGFAASALKLYEGMEKEGKLPDEGTLLCLLKACGNLKATEYGKLLYWQITSNNFELDTELGCAVIEMYVKCEKLEEATRVFNVLKKQNAVAWTTMILAYVEYENYLPALECFQDMLSEDIQTDKVVFLAVLKACCGVGARLYGMLVHNQIVENGVDGYLIVDNTIIDMYAKCGAVHEALTIFTKLPNQDDISWSTIIGAYAQFGDHTRACQCLADMKRLGIRPRGSTYTSILMSCCNSGQVDDGYRHFGAIMDDHNDITPTVEHFNCMIDLFGRAGSFGAVKKFLQLIPTCPDNTGWISLLTSCKTYQNVELGKWCYNQITQLDHQNRVACEIMWNIYTDAGLWDDACKLEQCLSCIGKAKKLEMPLIEHHVFKSYPRVSGNAMN